MVNEHSKDTKNPPIYGMSDAELNSSGNLNFDEVQDSDLTITVIRTNEVAIDLWTFEKDTKTSQWNLSGLYRSGVLKRLHSQHFAKRYRSDMSSTFLIRGDSIIKPVIDTVIRDNLNDYIESNRSLLGRGNISATYEGRMEIYIRQQHLLVNTKSLEMLPTHSRPLLRDNETTCYVPYQNGIVEISATGIDLLSYDFLNDRCVWSSQVLKRDFVFNVDHKKCHFEVFLQNVTNNEPDRLRSFRTAIGYLLHHHNNPAEGQAIICYDEEMTDARKPEGGTGKGVFCNAFIHMRPVTVIDGKKFDPDDRFCFQQLNEDTAVVWIDDPRVNHPKLERRFALERFFSILTEGWMVEGKNKQSFRIPTKEGPKLLISSNIVMANEGSSNVRRQFILEFGNYYKSKIKRGNEKPIQTEHGCIFFSDDWDTTEWQRFDNFMVGCVQEYLRDGLIPYELRSADQNRLRQVAGEEFFEWITSREGTGLLPDQEHIRDDLFREYKAFAGLPDNQPITRAFTSNIMHYAKGKGWNYVRGKNTRSITFRLVPQESCI